MIGRIAESEGPYSKKTQLENDYGAVYYLYTSGPFDEFLHRMGINVANLRLFQLVLTVMLTSVGIYLYTVIALNFFRKFHTKEEDGEKEYKCNDMLTVSDFSIIPSISSFTRRNKRYSFSPPFFPSSVSSSTTARICKWVVELEMRFNHPMETHIKR
ncbi:unnamed protein product [Taenia asiatica]|uniref:Uncharacterized protein n=1 Tax=Taenia asiatica TaxID=60517 RepID=A0A3P6NPM0_TAEAS|nr:unnamed protein product [Taenia asiatica]